MSYEEEYEDSNIKLVANKVADNSKIHATVATKADGPFYCPETFEELIIRKCIEKRDHFAYKARQSPVANRMSALHEDCQNELIQILIEKYPEGNWKKEREDFNEDEAKGYKKVRPDLSGRIENKGIIIEVQASSLSIKTILERTEQYTKRGGYILWIVPLEEDLGKADFRPRLFERYLHTMYFGRVYYWYKGSGTKLTPVHFGTASRYINESNWFDETGTEQSAGGYDKPYLRVKSPVYGQTVDLLSDFIPNDRESFEVENDKLSAPKSKIYMDKLETWWRPIKSLSR